MGHEVLRLSSGQMVEETAWEKGHNGVKDAGAGRGASRFHTQVGARAEIVLPLASCLSCQLACGSGLRNFEYIEMDTAAVTGNVQ